MYVCYTDDITIRYLLCDINYIVWTKYIYDSKTVSSFVICMPLFYINFRVFQGKYCMTYIYIYLFYVIGGAVVVVIIWQLDLQLPVQSVPITTKVVSSNPIHDEVYSIQHYVIKYVSDLWQTRWLSPATPVSSTSKTNHHDITEILLKAALNTINPTPM